jgi:spermidine/putrescine transport system ATP-binding protein
MSDRVAVMSRGHIQQVDVPQKIYNEPANGFVASFVGENNVFKGTLTAGEKFVTDVGDFAVTTGHGVTKDAKSRLYVRPEHVSLVAKPKAGGNAIAATVEDVSFEGNFAVVHLRDKAGRKLAAEIKNDSAAPPPAVGAATHVVFSKENARVLLDSDAVAYDGEE